MESPLCTRERREHLPSPAQTLTELYHYSNVSTLYVMIHVKDDGVKGMMIHVLLILSSTGHYFLAAIKVEKEFMEDFIMGIEPITPTPCYANSVFRARVL